MALILLANSWRLSGVFAAVEKPSVSPHPPIATWITVPSENLGLTSSIVVKSGHSVWFRLLKISERIKARATWVMFDSIDFSGTISCCLRG
jgi:hypothetical protein